MSCSASISRPPASVAFLNALSTSSTVKYTIQWLGTPAGITEVDLWNVQVGMSCDNLDARVRR